MLWQLILAVWFINFILALLLLGEVEFDE